MKKKFKIANIIEEGFLGGPQKRIINTCNFLDKKFETTVILLSRMDFLTRDKCPL